MARTFQHMQTSSDEEEESDDKTTSPKGFSCTDFCQMLVHFVVVHCSPMIMFYVGFRGYLETLTFWEATHTVITVERELGHRNVSLMNFTVDSVVFLGDFLDCIQTESLEMMESFAPLPDDSCIGNPGTASAWGLPIPLNTFFALLNYSALALVVIFVLVELIELLQLSKARGLGQGRYIAFTYHIQASRAYSILSIIIVVYTIGILLDTIRFLGRLYALGHIGVLKNFVNWLLLTLLSVVIAAVTLWQASATPEPLFDVTSEEFKDLDFKRGWSDVATANTDFVQQLGNELLRSKHGSDKELKAMCASPLAEVKSVLDALIED